MVARAAAENLTPVVLELGGQNPALVDESANLADAAKKVVWGAMAWGGQWCTSPGYAYVHESVAEAFVAEAKATLTVLFALSSRMIRSAGKPSSMSMPDEGRVAGDTASQAR